MELVKNIEDVIDNAKRFDKYIEGGNTGEKEFAIRCVARGKCFVVVKENDKFKFYPSKYIGYKGNSKKQYFDAFYGNEVLEGEEKYGDAAMGTFDGRGSNKAINKILGCICEKDYELSEKFIEYCNNIDLKGREKIKFWKKIIEL